MANRYLAGTPVTIRCTFAVEHVPATNPVTYDPTDPSTVTCIVQEPHGGVKHTYIYGVNAELTREALGAFKLIYDIPDAAPIGTHCYEWQGTGTALGKGDGTFYVYGSNII